MKFSIEQLINDMENRASGDYTTPFAFFNMVHDATIVKQINSLYARLAGDTITDVVLVGIGGSHLGVQAVYDALAASNYKKPKVQLHALTSIDSFTAVDFASWYAALVCDPNKRVITFVISKSGATFETAYQASVCLELLKGCKPETYREHMIVVTDEGSSLANACGDENIPFLLIPKNIGGRFSIFSVAGLTVLRFLDFDLEEFLAGARSVYLDEPLASARELFNQSTQGYQVYDTFIFMPHYAALGGWVRQLVGESLGKKGKGFLPTVSIGSQDLHSVIQYYFAGAHKAVTTFILPPEPALPMGCGQAGASIFSLCAGLSAEVNGADLQHAIIKGVLSAYSDAHKPYMLFYLRKDSLYDIGRFMQYKMIETVYIGIFMDINPFDQPAVELYKQATRTLLCREKKYSVNQYKT